LVLLGWMNIKLLLDPFPENSHPRSGLQSNIRMKIGYEADYSFLVTLFTSMMLSSNSRRTIIVWLVHRATKYLSFG
jgi:hypothetical protein